MKTSTGLGIMTSMYSIIYVESLTPAQNLTANRLLLPGSLSNNKQSINTYFICYLYYVLYYCNKLEENLLRKS